MASLTVAELAANTDGEAKASRPSNLGGGSVVFHADACIMEISGISARRASRPQLLSARCDLGGRASGSAPHQRPPDIQKARA